MGFTGGNFSPGDKWSWLGPLRKYPGFSAPKEERDLVAERAPMGLLDDFSCGIKNIWNAPMMTPECIYIYIPRSSRYLNFLPVGRFLLVKSHNFSTQKEDPGIWNPPMMTPIFHWNDWGPEILKDGKKNKQNFE